MREVKQATLTNARTRYDKALEAFEAAQELLYLARRAYDDAYEDYWIDVLGKDSKELSQRTIPEQP